jgi:RNA recognition motif-containing protein
MANKLFVGSLAFSATDDDVKDFFSAVGTVEDAKVIMDRDTGRSKGYAFVTMSTDDEAQKAIKELDGKELSGRPVNVSEARPREERPRREFNSGNRY